MTTAYTSLLGLALPVTGELSGTWGDTVNNGITSLLDTSVAGTTNISVDTDVTLTTTTGASNTARQAILLFSGARTALRTVVAPAQSKTYTVINATTGGFAVKLVGSGPTTGVTIIAGESAFCAWNGSDFVKVSNTGGAYTVTDLTVTGNTILGDANTDTATVNALGRFNALATFGYAGATGSTLTTSAPAFVYSGATTYTDTSISGGTKTHGPFWSFAIPTLANPTTATTYTNASTLYIAGAPAAGTNITITNPYSLYVAAGASYFGGAVSFIGNTTLTTTTVTSLTDSGLTAGRVTYAGTAGLLQDSANLTFNGTTLVANDITDSSLTAGRVTYAGTAGNLVDSANLTFNGTTLTANTIGAFTLGGTIAGGGNQINNVIIGTTTPLAGAFTTLSNIGLLTNFTNTVKTSGSVVNFRLLQTNEAVNYAALQGRFIGAAAAADRVFSLQTVDQGLANAGILSLQPDGGTLLVSGLTVGLGAGAVATNTAVGATALAANTSGAFNTAVGYEALTSNTDNSANTAVGYRALKTQGASAYQNTAVGAEALTANTLGVNNTGLGRSALLKTTTGANNTAVGFSVFSENTTGGSNVGLGYSAGINMRASDNMAIGDFAMRGSTTPANNTGYQNTAVGRYTMYLLTSGVVNTAVGDQALYSNTTGGTNTAVGAAALNGNISASQNTAVGYQASFASTTTSNMTAVGYQALYTGSYASTAVGYQAGYANASNFNTYIGYLAGVNDVSSGAVFNVFVGAEAGRYYGAAANNNNTAVGGGAMQGSTTVANNTGTANAAFGSGALNGLTGGSNNVAVGASALRSNTTSSFNTAVGFQSQYNGNGTQNTSLGTYAMFTNGGGTGNTVIGYSAVGNGSFTGSNNAVVGNEALYYATSSASNVAIGYRAAYRTTTDVSIVAIGANALFENTTGGGGSYNIAIGQSAHYYGNTDAYYNIAIGAATMIGQSNAKSAKYNTAIGNPIPPLTSTSYTMGLVTSGSYNVALGNNSMGNVTSGFYNTAIGVQALFTNSTGNANTMLGRYAGYYATSSNNTFVGMSSGDAITSGGSNTIIGRYTGNNGGLDIRTASNYIVLSDGDGNPRAHYDGNGASYLAREQVTQSFSKSLTGGGSADTIFTIAVGNPYGDGVYKFTVFGVDAVYPNGSWIQEIYVSGSREGSGVVNTAITQQDKVLGNNGIAYPTWSISVSGNSYLVQCTYSYGASSLYIKAEWSATINDNTTIT
jgi:hypothetical protein